MSDPVRTTRPGRAVVNSAIGAAKTLHISDIIHLRQLSPNVVCFAFATSSATVEVVLPARSGSRPSALRAASSRSAGQQRELKPKSAPVNVRTSHRRTRRAGGARIAPSISAVARAKRTLPRLIWCPASLGNLPLVISHHDYHGVR